MSTLIRMSKATALGLHACAYIAAHPGKRTLISELTRVCRARVDTMTKVVRRLVAGGVLTSRPGRKGGLALARPAAGIRLADIYGVFEDGLDPDKGCLFKNSSCEGQADGACVFAPEFGPIDALIERTLRRTRLSSVAKRCRARAPRRSRP